MGHVLANAIRPLIRGPGPIRLALLCLALGIGMTVAAYSVVDAVLLSPLPFEDGEELVTLSVDDVQRGLQDGPLTWAELNAARSTSSIAAAEAYYQRSFTLRGPDRAEHVSGAPITPGLIETLGVAPSLGRGFLADEGAEAGFENVALISDGLWRRHFGADPDAVGGTLVVNDRPMEIVGVMPAGFSFPDDQDLWLPLGTRDAGDAVRRYLSVVARLETGETVARAGRELAPLAARIGPSGLDVGERRITARSLRDAFVPVPAQRFLPLMLAGVGLLLLVACANVANLLLARSLDRDREMAVRSALGAGRWRLGRQLLAEVGVLAAAGAMLGLCVAWAWLRLVATRLPESLPYWIDASLSPRAALVVLGITVLAALVSGGAPLLRLLRTDPRRHLQTRQGSTPRLARLRAGIVAAEIALSLMLLVGAGLFIRSFIALTSEDVGFEDDRVVSVRILLSGDAYDYQQPRLRFYADVLERVASLPEVSRAVATTAIPAADGGPSRDVRPVGSAEVATASLIGSSHAFFETLGIPLLAGRSWSRGEAVDTTAAVAVLGESLARRLWPTEPAVGHEIEVERLGRLVVIGVAADVQYQAVGSAAPLAGMQLHVPLGRTAGRWMAILGVSRAADPDLERFVAAVAAADPTQAPFDARTLPARRADSSAIQRTFASLFTEFGALALVLALLGVYGTLAYEVRRRHHEFGVRIAVGATTARIVRLVLARTGSMVAIGIMMGLAGASLGSRFMASLLYGIGPLDPSVLAGVSLTILATALLATLVPAYRAARVQPVEVLRRE